MAATASASVSAIPLSERLSLPLYSWDTVHPNARLSYCRKSDEADHLLSTLPPGDYGFDMEWKPNFRKGERVNPVALVQIANDKTILLLQISAMAVFPERLKYFCESSDYTKTGVGIKDDAVKLFMDTGVSLYNCVDLSLLARSVDNARWKGSYKAPIGLLRLTENYCSLTLPKGKTARSNWEGVLNDLQQAYAANDAHCGYVLLQVLRSMLNVMDKTPASRCFSFDCVRSRHCEPSGATWHPTNPDYDPGPPPPPRPPRLPVPKADMIVGANNQPSHPEGQLWGRGRGRGRGRERGSNIQRARVNPGYAQRTQRPPHWQPDN